MQPGTWIFLGVIAFVVLSAVFWEPWQRYQKERTKRALKQGKKLHNLEDYDDPMAGWGG